MAHLPSAPQNTVVARHFEPLQTVLCIADFLGIRAILDDGSQMIGMSAAVWRRLGAPARSDHKLSVEAANKSVNTTEGVLPNFKVTIGGLDLYLQVQIVEDAAYDILLGRPFFTLTSAKVSHLPSGGTTITLTCPNTGAVVTLPTQPRCKHDPIIDLRIKEG
ncbi:hypothetical protein FA15DRAFT_596395 [Coprinopsis marcescibilis]|uniref:Aspartic peptidase DDI1-type domain-containing protein n=1 Tax=Coprinopsis marcescibilis TaxID=230819 RepID=A0A5C3KPR2_COPMA|nr:hypothetical protein FA15DRAFT_596395 [Coprinopsis marcescibilis]